MIEEQEKVFTWFASNMGKLSATQLDYIKNASQTMLQELDLEEEPAEQQDEARYG